MSSSQKTVQVRGQDAVERILYMASWIPGLNGRRGIPYVVVGDPGVGKTSRFKQMAQSSGMYFEGILASLRDPADFLGTGIPKTIELGPQHAHLDPECTGKMTVMEYAPAPFAVRAAMHERSVLLFDEINTAPPLVQAALLRVLFDGVVGELQLPPGVRMFAAMNRVEDAAGGFDIAPPLANRLGWLEMDSPDPNRFLQFIQRGGTSAKSSGPDVNAADVEAEVDHLWSGAYAMAAGQIGGYIIKNPGVLLQKPKAGSAAASKAWPSPRTHELAILALAGSKVFGLSETETNQAVGAYVGAGVANEINRYLKDNDLPDPELLLDKKVSFTHAPARLDRTAAVLVSCTSLVSNADCHDRQRRIDELWSILNTLPDNASDIALSSVFNLTNQRLFTGTAGNIAYKVMAKYEKVVVAAGLTASGAR